jgi:hypothetical protein
LTASGLVPLSMGPPQATTVSITCCRAMFCTREQEDTGIAGQGMLGRPWSGSTQRPLLGIL